MKKKYNPYPIWLTIPSIFFIAAFYLFPIVLGIGLAFTSWSFHNLEIKFIGLENFRSVLKDPDFFVSVQHTLRYAIVILVLRNVFAMILALGMNRKMRSTNFLRTVYFLPSVLSYVVVGIMFIAMLRMSGMVNQLLSAIVGMQVEIPWIDSPKMSLISVMMLDLWVWSGFHGVLLLNGLQTIDESYYEAAKIDGANSWKTFTRITLPLMIPSIRMSFVLTMIGALRVFEQCMVLTYGGPGNSSMTVNMYVYRLFGLGFYSKSSAVETMLAIVIFTLTFIITKLFQKKEMEVS